MIDEEVCPCLTPDRDYFCLAERHFLYCTIRLLRRPRCGDGHKQRFDNGLRSAASHRGHRSHRSRHTTCISGLPDSSITFSADTQHGWWHSFVVEPVIEFEISGEEARGNRSKVYSMIDGPF